jgi:hypothetical protein
VDGRALRLGQVLVAVDGGQRVGQARAQPRLRLVALEQLAPLRVLRAAPDLVEHVGVAEARAHDVAHHGLDAAAVLVLGHRVAKGDVLRVVDALDHGQQLVGRALVLVHERADVAGTVGGGHASSPDAGRRD